MGFVTRGFRGRPRAESDRVPPGQYVVEDFPVLSAGPTPNVSLDSWKFTIKTEAADEHSWTWPELQALPHESPIVDIHCVTKWSKLRTTWEGISLDALLADVETAADYALVYSYGGYTTNLPLEDLTDGKAWIVFNFDGEARPRTRRSCETSRAAPVPLEVGKVGSRYRPSAARRAGILGNAWLPRIWRSVARTAIRRGLSQPLRWQLARLVAERTETSTAKTLVLEIDDWAGHLPGQHVDVRLTAEDGYSTQRSYSIASAPDGNQIELTIQLLQDGEVSPLPGAGLRP